MDCCLRYLTRRLSMRPIALILKESEVTKAFLLSDVSATIIPATLVGIAAGIMKFGIIVFPVQAVVYVFLYAITFTISNQLLTAEEDRANGKLHRPIVRGLITISGARVRLVIWMAAFVALSAYTNVLLWSLTWIAVTVILNFLGGSNHWLSKNLGMEIGTVVLLTVPWLLVAGEIPASAVPQILGIAISVLVLIGIQDLRDVAGDAPTRKTFPIVFGNSARYFFAIGFCALPIWTHLYIFPHPIWLALPMDAISLVIAVRVLKYRNQPDDTVSYWLLTCWLSTATFLMIVFYAMK